MKAIACAIMFAALWHTPISLWSGFSDEGKVVIAMVGIITFISFIIFLIEEK